MINNRSAFDETFLSTVDQWIRDNGEVYIVIRYAYAAGSRDYRFVHSFAEFKTLLASQPPLADVIVFRKRQLPIRGVADEALLERALKEIPEGEEWFLLYPEGANAYEVNNEESDSHQVLKASFEEYWGKYVCVGPDPPFHKADNPDMQSGEIPSPDGTTPPATY